MLRNTILALSAAAILGTLVPDTAEARKIRRDGGDSIEQRLIREAERDRAWALGGYSDPITFFSKLFRGEDVSSDIQPVINDYKEPRPFLRKPATR